jgi:signal transduction histidine kinase
VASGPTPPAPLPLREGGGRGVREAGAPLPSEGRGAGGVRSSGEMAIVRVEDRGIGIGTETARRVFERFYQAGSVPVRGHVGLGLGLYISREIVTRHGGEMGVDSTVGQGSTFWFTLPLARPPADE